VATGKEVHRLFSDWSGEPLAALALSPDGLSLAAGVDDHIGLIHLPDGSGRGSCKMPRGKLKSIRFSPDSRSLAAVFECVGVCLFDLNTTQLLWQNTDQPTDAPHQDVAFAPDGRTLVVA